MRPMVRKTFTANSFSRAAGIRTIALFEVSFLVYAIHKYSSYSGFMNILEENINPIMPQAKKTEFTIK